MVKGIFGSNVGKGHNPGLPGTFIGASEGYKSSNAGLNPEKLGRLMTSLDPAKRTLQMDSTPNFEGPA